MADSLENCANCFSPARRPKEDRLSPWRCCRVLLRSEDDRFGGATGVGEVSESRKGDASDPVN